MSDVSRALVGTGTTIDILVDGSSIFGTNPIYILDVKPPPYSREKIETTHLGTRDETEIENDVPGQGTNLPSTFAEWGEAELEIAFFPGIVMPIGVMGECVITFPNGATWTFDGFITKYSPKVPLEDRMTATITMKATGGVVYAAGS